MPTKMLCILDGLGLTQASSSNAVSLAKMPTFRKILSQYPWITLNADGEFVGQEDGLVGNSEVGHTNIGGLKLVKQLSLQITESALNNFSQLADDQLFDPKNLLAKKFASFPKTIHLFGLFSTSSVHSDMRHWIGAINSSLNAGADKIVLHLISDGRDSDRQSLVATWQKFMQSLKLNEEQKAKIVLGSLGGRFYLMDRDKNYGRNWQGLEVCLSQEILEKSHQIKEFFAQELNTQIDFNTFTSYSEKVNFDEIQKTLEELSEASYSQNNFDETIVPVRVSENSGLKSGETVWLINFRTDRLRQLTTILTGLNQNLKANWTILTTNDYGAGDEIYLDSNLENFNPNQTDGYYPIFRSQPSQNTLAQRIAEMGKTQLHIAETEKYNHVTFFLNGCQQIVFEGEEDKLIPSNKVQSHAEMPEMKSREITNYIVQNYQKYDYIIANYAAPDMIGHTGDIQAAITTLEFLDTQLARIMELVDSGTLEVVLISDHGNIEVVGEVEVGGQKFVDTAHNPNPVPCVFIKNNFDINSFCVNLQKLKDEYKLDLDIANFRQEFQSRINPDLNNPKDWLDTKQIKISSVPLWYSGAFLLAL